jgi:hypothetical protein
MKARRSRGMPDAKGGREDGVIAPIKGLNTQAPLAGLDSGFAVKLDNFICQPDALVTRGGAITYASGFSTAPKTLIVYSSGTKKEFFAANSVGIFNVSGIGAIGVAVIAVTRGQGKFVNMATSAGQFLYFVNGVDFPKLYNGATWADVTAVSSPAITGVVPSTFFDVEVYRARLYFLQNQFLGFYYLPSDSVGGIATAFRIGALCRLGGFVVAHGTWSVDGGFGPDDHYVLATSNGELVVWVGSDPSSTATWRYIGTFYVGKPLGQNCFAKFGGDLLYLCENGLIPLSQLLQSTNRNYTSALTYRIQPSIAKAVNKSRNQVGWKVHVIPRLSLVLLNIPSAGVGLPATQFAYNSYSKAWSTLSGWNAADFLEYDDRTFYTTGLQVAEAFVGASDFGNDIVALCDTSYNRFGTREQLQPLLMRALHASNNKVEYTLGLAQDFTDEYKENVYAFRGSPSGLWNSGLWNTALWGGGYYLYKDWVTIASNGGLALSTRFKVSSKVASTIVLAFDYKFAQQGLVS